MIKKGLLIVFGAFFCGSLYAQVSSFTPDSVEFLDQVETLLSDLKKQEAKDFIKEFEPVWFGGKFTESQRLKVYQTANSMLDQKLRPWPDFHDYLFSLMSFVQSGQTEESFNAWTATIDQLLDGKNKKNFSEYISFCSILFSSNDLYQTTSTVWQASNGDYEFKFENDEPYIQFENLDLRCFAKGDSIVIYNTQGTYYPLTLKWYGTGGKVTWERAGLDVNETYAVFEHDYDLGLKSSSFQIDSVLFYNKYFTDPLMGKITDKALSANTDMERTSYPQFDSYDKRLEIRDIIPGVDYDGGFAMQGAEFIGSGTREELARMIFYRDDIEFLRSEAIIYFISPERIAADNAIITIYIEMDQVLDSIVHKNIQFKYIHDEKKLTLIRTDVGTGRSPFTNSYHKLDMYFESLSWNVEDDFMYFEPLFQSSATEATFESNDYYTQRRFDDLFGLDDVHVLYIIRELAQDMGFWDFQASQLAERMHKPLPQVQQVLMTLNNLGYVYYDTEEDYVYVNERTENHVLARSGKVDYDILQFNSDIKNATVDYNAKLSLINYDLIIEGITKVVLSDTQKVAIYPDAGQVIVQKNRDFAFAGKLNAGKTQVVGSDFTFDYNEFKINMIDVDYMAMGAREFGEYQGYRPLVTVTTLIEGLKGTVFIDNPFNKSGLDTSFHNYPIMQTTDESYAYYDRKGIYGGVYDRENFYFKLDTFTMDSLDVFTNEGIAFDGLFVSGGIFPEFRETLGLQPDYSLGFVRKTPEDGFELYADRGEFNETIALSGSGLQGSGTIDFLTSKSVSERFTFFPDSTVGIAQTFDNQVQTGDPEIPPVYGVDIHIKYIPGDQVLYASKVDSALHFFNDQADLHGTLALREEGMTGRGMMSFENAELRSEEFTYREEIIEADTAEFQLLSYDLAGMAFKTDNVKAYVDFAQRMGEFESNGEESFVEFPENQYICYMDYFKWYMDQDELELAKTQDITIDYDMTLSGSNFYSTHPNQDSLNFMSPKAVYSLKDKVVTCKDVPFIQVADVLVTPDSNKIYIQKKAKIDQLQNAQILANATNRYHQIFNATVDIYGKYSYEASGDYLYVDENQSEQTVHFNEILTDSSLQTYAVGEISESHNFTLSPQFEFIGKMTLNANNKLLEFEGATRISHDCPGIAKNWMNFTAEIDPNSVYIPVGNDLVDQLNNPIGAGIIMGDSTGLYSTFLSVKEAATDPDVIGASGLLHYDKSAHEYQISNKEKLVERSLPGNYISLNTETCVVSGDGMFGFGTNLHQVTTINVGELTHNMASDEMDIQATMVIDFPMNDDAMKKMVTKMLEYPDLEPFDIGESTYEKALREIVGLEEADEIISELALKNKLSKKMSEQLQAVLVLGDINFKWNDVDNAFQSYGKIGIVNSGKELIFKEVDGFVEIVKDGKGDKITIYLKLDDNNWWYFSYDRGLMKVLSSDAAFNTAIQDMKPDDRKFKGDKGIDDYQFMLEPNKTTVRKFEDKMAMQAPPDDE